MSLSGMGARKIIGMLTPSSNTVLEPVTASMVSGLSPEVSVHFARFPVTEISLGEAALGQFDPGPQLAAARLLADARADVIAWNGTSGGWLGLEADRRLCAAITETTGAPATTASLALLESFRMGGFRRYALVTPYLKEIQQRIIATFAEEGFTCVDERHLGDKGNFSFAEVSEARIGEMVRAVAASEPPVITTYCTNLRGAPIAPALEPELGIPIHDSVSVTLWHCLRLCDLDPARVEGWGALFGGTAIGGRG